MTESLAALITAFIFLFFAVFSAIVAGVRGRILTRELEKSGKKYNGDDLLVIIFAIFSLFSLVLFVGNLVASVWKAI